MNQARNDGYSSKKHPVLEYIFKKYYNPKKPQKIIPFYLKDISDGYRSIDVPEPASISNTILDLCRQNRGIGSRLPKSIYEMGYDLRKKTGSDPNGKHYAGEFVLVGVGNEINSWLSWPTNPQAVIISSKNFPDLTALFIRPDEGGLFSIIDYTDMFSQVLHGGNRKVCRIENPMKWWPNEIDGFYASQEDSDIDLYPVEAKALTTNDEINMDQLKGGYKTVVDKIKALNIKANVQQEAVRMIENGVDIAVFPVNTIPETPECYIRVKFDPVIQNWK